jgi:D-arabinose 1-dehydrogenase-like Zn-dependent alcohol dehydrogenase
VVTPLRRAKAHLVLTPYGNTGNALTTDPVEAIQELGGADVAVALAASPAAFDQAYRSLRRGGRLVCVALPADNATLSLPIFDTVINGKTVIGSIVGTRNDLADVFALHAAGRTTVIAVDRKIDEVNQSIDDVLRTRRRAGTSRPPHPASRNNVTASVKGWEPPGVYSEHLLVRSSKPELCA